MLVRLGSAGPEVVEPDQVEAELSRVLWCQECYRKICIYLKNVPALLSFSGIKETNKQTIHLATKLIKTNIY